MQITSDYFRRQQRDRTIYERAWQRSQVCSLMTTDIKPLKPSIQTLRSLANLRKNTGHRRVA